MAFYGFGLNLGRGQTNTTASEDNIATHTYKYESDTLADISSASYFPDYLGGGIEEVLVNDILLCRGSDGVDTFTITALAPLTIEPQEEATGNVTGPVSSTLNAVPHYTDTTGKVIGNTGITIDGSNNLTTTAQVNTGTLNVTGQAAVFGNTTTASDWSFHERGARSVTHWIEADTSNDPGEGYNPGIVMTQDGNNSAFRLGYANDNQVRLDIASGAGSPNNDTIITTNGTLVGGGVIGTLPTITPGTVRVTIPAAAAANIAVVPGISLNNVTFAPVAANPGGQFTMWVKSSNSHLMCGATDTGLAFT
jgi:hypothetical protein